MKAKIQMAHQVITGYQGNFYRAKKTKYLQVK